MNLKAVIFDKDGVLINTEHFVTESVNDAIIHFGGKKTFTAETKAKYAGFRQADMYEVVKKENGFDMTYEVYREFQLKRYFELLKQNPPKPIAGVLVLIESLKSNGIKIAVGTGSAHLSTKESLSYSGLLDYFDVVVCAEDVENGKPAPDVFLKAAEMLGVDISECIVIGDAHNDRIAAKSGGFKFVFFNSHKGEYPDEHIPELVVESLTELTLEKLQSL